MMDLLSGILLSLAFGITPMVVFSILVNVFDRYEKEPFILLFGVFSWGFIVATGAAFVLNTVFDVGLFLVTGNRMLADTTTSIVFAPVIEEAVKGLALLLLYIFIRDEIDGVLDGIIYGCMVGFGFAAAENVLYIFAGYLNSGLEGLLSIALLRILLIPFVHATFTGITGIGFALAHLKTWRLRYLAPLGAFMCAVMLHATHNFLVLSGIPFLQFLNFTIDWVGATFIFIMILILAGHEKKIIQENLLPEIEMGNMTLEQYSKVVSPYKRALSCLACRGEANRARVKRFYDLAAELAFKKQRKKTHPEDDKAGEAISGLREEMRALSRVINV